MHGRLRIVASTLNGEPVSMRGSGRPGRRGARDATTAGRASHSLSPSAGPRPWLRGAAVLLGLGSTVRSGTLTRSPLRTPGQIRLSESS